MAEEALMGDGQSSCTPSLFGPFPTLLLPISLPPTLAHSYTHPLSLILGINYPNFRVKDEKAKDKKQTLINFDQVLGLKLKNFKLEVPEKIKVMV